MFTSSNANNADIVVTFEGYYDPTPPGRGGLAGELPGQRFLGSHLRRRRLHGSPARFGVRSLAQQNIGYVYVGTWYDLLPPYFSTFLADAAGGLLARQRNGAGGGTVRAIA